MPFVQRVVQPTQLAQVSAASASATGKISRFQCVPGKCSNNNCINNKPIQRESSDVEQIESIRDENGFGETTIASRTTTTCVKDKGTQQQQHQLTGITTVTKAIIHSAHLNGDPSQSLDVIDHAHNQTNGFAASFTYATDTEEEVRRPLSPNATLTANAAALPMKKLKQHVEFLSIASPSARSPTRSSSAQSARASQRRPGSTPQSPTAARIVSGYEFDSISNITLSNALRQLASLVLIASDIFDDLQRELQDIGDRTRTVQRKMFAVERRVCAYDPKTVTVPESDLLTFAQRKTHYESEKTFRKELFTAETRPQSVRALYEEAGKASPPPSAATTPRSTSFTSDGAISGDGIADASDAGATMAAGSDELVCTPVFGEAKRKMRTRIDAEIEIRLPAAIEELRKWTSSEALGDVTVTPDCMHHVDTSISTSVVIGDNGVLTPALSPSVLSADAIDALYSINVSSTVDNSQIPNDINKDVPLNHRLPSPEEQCKIIALRYPAELVSVDTSGRRFERMCMARKSTTGCFTNIAETNNLNDEVQTVSRRSRSRKVRGKRRNTIAGIDQKEIQDAANGDSTITSGGDQNRNNTTSALAASANDDNANGCDEETRRGDKSKKFGRSKSSDILKKESVALPYDKGKSTLTRLNSLKQWGRNRFKFMQRCEPSPPAANGVAAGHDTAASISSSPSPNTSTEKAESAISGSPSKASTVRADGDGDSEGVTGERHSQKSDGRFSHERKPSYSSSEKSVSVSSSGHLRGKLHLATCGNVKLRDTSSLNRQRRNGISATGLGGKDEQPHSSSGNWSASSESGRASIGSEITIQPKSSASNTSLNVSSFHPGSGPPSSMLSRRRFLNTSASSSVTSDGTATPDLQVTESVYPNHLDDETSSAYSCDTEGYYTSFHMDSGLRTLKEEEPLSILPLQHNQNLHTSNYSFGSQSNQTVLTAENEYELFGRGSTSTTTSSAGTVCTTLMVSGEQSSLNGHGPDVPERISSLGKLNKSNQSNSNSASSSTLERSYSSSTIGSTLERTGTIKRNVNTLKLSTMGAGDDGDHQGEKPLDTPESQEGDFDFKVRVRKRSALPLPTKCEVECSESSDLEGVERIERIKQKTAINAKRIPSMCIITPTTSDDENQAKEGAYDPNRTLTNDCAASPRPDAQTEATLQFIVNESTGYCTVDVGGGSGRSVAANDDTPRQSPTKIDNTDAGDKDHNLNVLKRHSHYGFNHMLEKLKVVLPNMKRSPAKSSPPTAVLDDDELYDTAGEYVTITDISNNNRHRPLPVPKAVGASSLGIYYSNDIVRRTAATQEGIEPSSKRTNEYVSLNELPEHLRKGSSQSIAIAGSAAKSVVTSVANNNANIANHAGSTGNGAPSTSVECADSVPVARSESATVAMYAEITEMRDETADSPLAQHKGARVRVNAQGKFIYDSDSLKRRKGAHTTFAPGPYVKETESALDNATATATGTGTATVSAGSSASAASESASLTTKANNLVPNASSAAAKLLLLNGGIAATRKVVNVRPIVSSSSISTSSAAPSAAATATLSPNARPPASNMSTAASAYLEHQQQLRPPYSSQTQTKHFLANSASSASAAASAMMPSPSTKSTSSTGSTISSTASTHTSGSSSSSSNEEGYQRFYKTSDQTSAQPTQPIYYQANEAGNFQRGAPIYWTLQNRRQTKPQTRAASSRDDLYATPIRRSERAAAAAAAATARAMSTSAVSSNISPIVPRNSSEFLTSTPTKRNAQWDDVNAPERLNTCSDRIGHSKTSLLDFKKLLLAKSTKSSPVLKKVSAVELLKKGNASSNLPTAPTAPAPSNSAQLALNSSMKLLDLSGSPKTFANRRMLRQGQFGSPSKSFAPKLKSSPVNWRAGVVPRTDIMSTTIPEANSEEDHSNTSGSNSSRANSESRDVSELQASKPKVDVAAVDAAAQRFDLKRNFFLQTEENNFMRGELRHSFGKGSSTAVVSERGLGTSAGKAANSPGTANSYSPGASYGGAGGSATPATGGAAPAAALPALETAL